MPFCPQSNHWCSSHPQAHRGTPMDYVDQMAQAGGSGFTFHVEVAKENCQQPVEKLNSAGMRPAVALKPGTPVEQVEGTTPVQMMTVEPGFGGHKFMPNMMDKVRAMRHKYPTLDYSSGWWLWSFDHRHSGCSRRQLYRRRSQGMSSPLYGPVLRKPNPPLERIPIFKSARGGGGAETALYSHRNTVGTSSFLSGLKNWSFMFKSDFVNRDT